MNRREMMGMMGAAAAGVAAGACTNVMGSAQTQPAVTGAPSNGGGHGVMHTGQGAAAMAGLAGAYDPAEGRYTLPPLPYDYDALEPAIDAQTMKLHHDKHHAGYVRGLNTALDKLAEARKSGDYAMVQYWSRKVSFNGGGHTLHTIFWQNMAPPGHGGGGQPKGALAEKIKQCFGSLDAMKAQFEAAAAAVEGSGWGILGHEILSGNLIIIQGENQQKLTTWGVTPVLVLDVWEHAYYLKYQNRRADYVRAFWSVVNWNDVARRVAMHGHG